jgi:hypothetical protein
VRGLASSCDGLASSSVNIASSIEAFFFFKLGLCFFQWGILLLPVSVLTL